MQAERWHLRPESFIQWMLLAVCVLLVASGAGAVLNFLFTPAAIAVGLYLYFRSAARDYLSFSLWLWMLTPLVRRLSDWQGGFQVVSLIIVAPLLVSLICLLGLSRRSFWSFSPAITITVVCLYGALVGLLNGAPFAVAYALLTWLAPLALAGHIMCLSDRGNEMADVMFRTLAVGALVMGLYGLDQYFFLRPWDAHWMTSAEMGSIGLPLPQQVRAFGTMNSPGPFAAFMAAGLLAIFAKGTKLTWLASPFALAAFALSLVRSSWGSFTVGLFLLIILGHGKNRWRYILMSVIALMSALPLLTYDPIASRFMDRLETLQNLEEDRSFSARLEFSQSILDDIGPLIVGTGLGQTGLGSRLASDSGDLGDHAVFDNGVLDLFFTFGLGAFAILISLGATSIRLMKAARYSRNTQIAAAISLGALACLIFGNSLAAPTGILILPFMALALVQKARRPDAAEPHLGNHHS